MQCVAPWKGKIKLMDSFEDAWKVISDYCKSKITDIAYNTWISRIQPVDLDFDNGTAYLRPNIEEMLYVTSQRGI